MGDTTPKSYSADPTLYLYTSLTAGSSHIITATSRLETILKANKIPFRALDVATDEKARMLWGRRSKGKKLPGLVKFGNIVGDLEQVEEWNEYGELKQQIGATVPVAAPMPAASASSTPSKASPASAPVSNNPSTESSDSAALPPSPGDTKAGDVETPLINSSKREETPLTKAMRQAGAEAAKKAGEKGGTKSKAPPSLKGGEASEVQMPVVQTGRAKSVEEPNASADVTAGKTPEKLAKEGAERTSVGKIADEGTKRLDETSDVELGSRDEPQTGDLSKEASALQARRISSISQAKSPLSGDAATTSITGRELGSLEPTSSSQGEIIVPAPKGEIEETEKQKAITEEEEPIDESSTGLNAEPAITAPKAGLEVESGPESSTNSKITDLAASDEGELAATKGVKPQGEDAREGREAGTSVGD